MTPSVNTQGPSSQDVSNFRPTRLSQVVGNDEAKQVAQSVMDANGRTGHVLITGDVGTGKTSICRVLVSHFTCPSPKAPRDGGCGECAWCRSLKFECREYGLYRLCRGTSDRPRFNTEDWPGVYSVDARSIDTDVLEQHLENVEDETCRGNQVILVIDEVDEIVSRRGRAGRILEGPLESFSNCTFIVTTARKEKLPPDFVRRFTLRRETVRPETHVLVKHLCQLANEFQVTLDTVTAEVLAKRSRGRVSECYMLLSQAAATASRDLSIDLVKRHNFLP